jgi:hypothetical protein
VKREKKKNVVDTRNLYLEDGFTAATNETFDSGGLTIFMEIDVKDTNTFCMLQLCYLQVSYYNRENS